MSLADWLHIVRVISAGLTAGGLCLLLLAAMIGDKNSPIDNVLAWISLILTVLPASVFLFSWLAI